MVNDNDFKKESSSIIEEIESQLQDVLEKRKKAVEEELEEKIRQAQEEANKRKNELESQLKDEQEALVNYKNVLSQYENNKDSVKTEIKSHLDKAIALQTEIEEKTALSLDELKIVSDLTQKLEGINLEAGEKVKSLKTELEEKYGIVTQVPDSIGQDEVDFDLETELRKLQKIKELLGEPGALDEGDSELKKKIGVSPESLTEDTSPAEAPEVAAAEAEAEAEDEVTESSAEPPPEEEKAEEEDAAKAPEPSEETTPDFTLSPELEQYKDNESVLKAAGSLSKYLKREPLEEGGEVIYYQKDDKMILEGENLFVSIGDSLDQAKQLYIKLSETESPKEQFFIKQEIIKYQDNLRKVMLSLIRWNEKENCSLPNFTEEVLNPNVLKSLLEKVSMENWSNKDDFSSFEEFAKELKEGFYSLLSPPDKYFGDILDHLEKR